MISSIPSLAGRPPFLWFVLLLTFVGVFLMVPLKGPQPSALSGTIDLRGWDFNSGVVKLNGQWRYVPNQLLDTAPLGLTAEYSQVPGGWKQNRPGTWAFSGQGTATYFLSIVLDPKQPSLALAVPIIHSSYRLYLNGVLVQEMGVVSASRQLYQPAWKPVLLSVPSGVEQLELQVQVANFDHFKGGILFPVQLGSKELLTAQKSRALVLEAMLFSGILMMALYNFTLYWSRGLGRSPLYFSVVCLVLAVRLMVTGELLGLGYFSHSFELLLRLRNVSYFVGLGFFCLYTADILPDFFNSLVLKVVVNISFGMSAVAMLLPVNLLTLLILPMEILILLAALYVGWVIFQAIRAQCTWAISFALGFAVFLPTVINDVLYDNNLRSTFYMAPFGLFAFLLCQSFMIYFRFSEAFLKGERMGVELKEKNIQLNELDHLKDEFLSMTSHELKTPLHGIIGVAENFPPQAHQAMGEEGQANLEVIVSCAKRLSNLVDDLLDFNALKNGALRLNRGPTDLRVCVDLVIQGCKPLVSIKDIRLENRVPEDFPLLWVDESRLQQVFYNLLGNAIKFNQKGQVIVDVYAENNQAIITVSDPGTGISPENLTKVFDPFFQEGESLTRTPGGNGLGLAITKKIVKLHGGDIRLSSQPNLGTKVSVSLPLATKESALDAANIKPIVSRRPQSLVESKFFPEQPSGQEWLHQELILVVDDEVASLQAQNNMLVGAGYQVVTKESAIEALDFLKTQKPDLILVDMMMPRMSGFELVKCVREDWSAVEMPVIMLTARNAPLGRLDAFSAGVNDYLTKPVQKAELDARIRNQLQLRQLDGAPVNDLEVKLPNLGAVVVGLMNELLGYWEQSTGKTKVDLAEESGIWNVYLDNGSYKTRTLDRYLSVKQCPKKPRVKEILKTMDFLSNYRGIQPEIRQKIEIKKKEFVNQSIQLGLL